MAKSPNKTIPETMTTTQPEKTEGRLSSVTAAMRVLKAFSEEEAELGISSLAKRLGLAKSTVHRLAVTLVSEGLLEQNPETGRYRLGIALFALGTLVRRRMDVSNQSMPFLAVLRERTGETVNLAILDHTNIMYLYNLESPQAIRMRSYIGARRPAFCTSEGRAMLAFSPPELVRGVIAEGLVARTPNTQVSPKELLAALEAVRTEGYALDDEESEIGMRGVAAPVRDMSGHVVAAVGMGGPTQRLTKKSLRGFIPLVLNTAEAISVRLGYRPT